MISKENIFCINPICLEKKKNETIIKNFFIKKFLVKNIIAHNNGKEKIKVYNSITKDENLRSGWQPKPKINKKIGMRDNSQKIQNIIRVFIENKIVIFKQSNFMIINFCLLTKVCSEKNQKKKKYKNKVSFNSKNLIKSGDVK